MLLLISLIFALLHLPGDSGPFEHGPYDTWEYHNNAVYVSNYSQNVGAMIPKVQPFIDPEPSEGACPFVDGYGWSGLSWPTDSRRLNARRLFGGDGFHRGIDIYADVGSPVYAASSGVVIWAGLNYNGWGQTVILAHGSHWTIYAHLSTILVSCGQVVARGATLGTVGMSGLSSYPHLHFEVRQGAYAVDPLQWLSGYELVTTVKDTETTTKETINIDDVQGGNK